MPINRHIAKEEVVYIRFNIMEHGSAIKRNDILPLATAQTDLECSMLSEINQTEKDKYHIISLTRSI